MGLRISSGLPIVSWQQMVTDAAAREMGPVKAVRAVGRLCTALFEVDFPAEFVSSLGLSKIWQDLAMATHAMIWGRGERMRQILEKDFPDNTNRPGLARRSRAAEHHVWLEAEIAFLRATSVRYSGSGREFLALHESRHRNGSLSDREYAERIELKYLLQLGCQLLNQGRCKESQQLLDQVLGNDLYLDLSSAMVATSASALNFVNLGLISRAKQRLAELRGMGRLLPSRSLLRGPPWRAGSGNSGADYARLQSQYITLVCSDSERVLPDRKLLRELNTRLADTNVFVPSQFDLLSHQTLVRVYLRSGMLALAEQSMRSLSTGLGRFRLASEIINFAEERLELSIMQKQVTGADCERAREEIAAAIQRGDLRSEMRLKMLLGAAYALLNNLRESTSLLVDAARIGVAQSLKADLFDVYFHLAGLCFIQKNRPKALGYLDLCVALAREQNAVSLADAFAYLADVFETQQLDPEKVAALARASSTAINDFYLYHYGFLERIEFSAGRAGVYRSLSERLTREVVRPQTIVYFEAKLMVLIAEKKGSVVARGFAGEEDFAAILFALFDGKNGLTIAQMHALRSPSSRSFDSVRHSPVIRGFITRLRHALDGTPLALEFSATTGCYALRAAMPVTVVRSHSVRRHAQGNRRSTREEFIMQFARAHGRFQVAELCRELRVTRQALHPVLTRLVERGDLILVRRGRSSGYRLAVRR